MAQVFIPAFDPGALMSSRHSELLTHLSRSPFLSSETAELMRRGARAIEDAWAIIQQCEMVMRYTRTRLNASDWDYKIHKP
jgi:hypothetical protein